MTEELRQKIADAYYRGLTLDQIIEAYCPQYAEIKELIGKLAAGKRR